MKIHESVRTRWLFLINLPHRILHPPARALARIVCFAVLLFILYFQFFFGPPLLTLAVLFLCFPVNGILWMGLAAVIGASLPLPAAVLPAPEE